MARPPSLTVLCQAMPCSCNCHRTSVQLSPSTATGLVLAQTAPLWTSTSALVGFAVCAAIQFIQRQRSQRVRGIMTKPVLGQLACALDHRCNLAQADVLSKPRPQTLLHASITRVALYQQRQDRSLQGASRRCSLGRGGKSGFQGRQPLGFPSVEGLASNADLLTQSTDDSIAATVGQQHADPLCVVVGCARMCLDHWFLPGGEGDEFYQPYLPGSFLQTRPFHMSKSFSLFLNLPLKKPMSTYVGEKQPQY